jgi:hypothetical protein
MRTDSPIEIHHDDKRTLVTGTVGKPNEVSHELIASGFLYNPREQGWELQRRYYETRTAVAQQLGEKLEEMGFSVDRISPDQSMDFDGGMGY